jgi:hypothetical protein
MSAVLTGQNNELQRQLPLKINTLHKEEKKART